MVAPSVDQPVSLYVFPSMCFALWVSPLSETGRRPVPGPFCALRLGFRGRGVRRFGGRADAPYVLFICQDDAQRDDFLARADRELTGHRWHPLRPADQHETPAAGASSSATNATPTRATARPAGSPHTRPATPPDTAAKLRYVAYGCLARQEASGRRNSSAAAPNRRARNRAGRQGDPSRLRQSGRTKRRSPRGSADALIARVRELRPEISSSSASTVPSRTPRRSLKPCASAPPELGCLRSTRGRREAHGGPAFPTRNGTRQHPDAVRSRLLASVRERANELLAEREQREIGHMTPHTLRRTFASILAEVGVPPRRAMYLLGHMDPTLTMRVYQQVLDMGGVAVETLGKVLGCTLDEALATYSGRGGLGSQWVVSPKAPARRPRGPSRRCLRLCRARSERAAEGIRTLDLLHGKQNVGEGSRPQVACKQRVFSRVCAQPGVWGFTPIYGNFED
jgi:Phage integrase family